MALAHDAASDPNPSDTQMFLAFLAEHHAADGRPEFAARLLGALESLSTTGYEEAEDFRVRSDRARTAVTDSLGDKAEALIAEGRGWSYDDAVAAIVSPPMSP